MIFLWVRFCVIIFFALKTQDIFLDGKHCRLPVVWLYMERRNLLLSMLSYWLLYFLTKGKTNLQSSLPKVSVPLPYSRKAGFRLCVI